MKNIDRIKQMTSDEMAEFLGNNASFFLVKKKFDEFVNDNSLKQWLESEENEPRK